MNAVNDLDTATALRETKAFPTLAARFALHGYEPVKSDAATDGQTPYFAARWGIGAQPLQSLEAARRYLEGQVGAGDVTD